MGTGKTTRYKPSPASPALNPPLLLQGRIPFPEAPAGLSFPSPGCLNLSGGAKAGLGDLGMILNNKLKVISVISLPQPAPGAALVFLSRIIHQLPSILEFLTTP